MPSKVIQAVGLDAGSRYTRCLAAVVENGRIVFKGCAQVESQGWLNAAIADQGAVSDSIRAALRETERTSGLQLEEVVVGVGGPAVRGHNSRGHVDFGQPREIEQRDVNRVVERALRVQLPEDRMVLQLGQQDFIVDDHPGHRDPRQMIATELELNVHLITASVQEHASLVSAVHQAHMAVEETVFEALAACHAAVLAPERREGIAVVDIGSQSTDVVVYYGDSLQLAGSVRVGSDHFTRDVVHGLHIGFADAEMVKEEYGCAVAGSTSASSTVEVPPHPEREGRDVSRRILNEILEARALDLFHLVWRELSRVGMQSALVGGVVLTGGGAKLADICVVAEHVLNCQARKGLPAGIRGWPDEIYDPAWATAAGLAMYSGRLKLQGEMDRRAVGILGRMLR
jgi:cell division protein FtsA